MSHRDSVTAPPAGARVVAGLPSTPIAAFEDPDRGRAASNQIGGRSCTPRT